MSIIRCNSIVFALSSFTFFFLLYRDKWTRLNNGGLFFSSLLLSMSMGCPPSYSRLPKRRNPRRHDRLIVTHDDPKAQATCCMHRWRSVRLNVKLPKWQSAVRQSNRTCPQLTNPSSMIIDIVSALTAHWTNHRSNNASVSLPCKFWRTASCPYCTDPVIFSFVFTTVMCIRTSSIKKSVAIRFILDL